MQANRAKHKHFNSFGSYLAHLEKILIQAPAAEKRLLNAIGIEVEAKAKSKFGHYQNAVGPFEKWDELTEGTQEDRVRKEYTPNDPLLRDGTLRESISHSVHGKTVSIGSTNEIMPYHEFGTSRIPARPVLGPAMFQSKYKIKVMAAKAMLAWLTHRVSDIK